MSSMSARGAAGAHICTSWCTACCKMGIGSFHTIHRVYQTQSAASGDALLHWCGRETAADKGHHSETRLAAPPASQVATHVVCNKFPVVGSFGSSLRKYTPLGCTHFRRPVVSPIRHRLRAAAAEPCSQDGTTSDVKRRAADAGVQGCRAECLHAMGLGCTEAASPRVLCECMPWYLL
jgi:hypothetical protein